MLAVGVDAYHGGWVAVALGDGSFHSAAIAPTLAALIAAFPTAAAVRVDIPIGLPAGGCRSCDEAARVFVGPRRNSVFMSPPLPALQRGTFQEALATCRGLTGKGLSQQAYALKTKILEAATVADTCDVMIEVHPEVSFRAMAGRPLVWPKTTWSGMWDRLDLLANEGISLPHAPGAAGAVAVDDLIDAAAAAWSAARWAARTAQSVAEPEKSSTGRPVSIWY